MYNHVLYTLQKIMTNTLSQGQIDTNHVLCCDEYNYYQMTVFNPVW